jgi:hypothetical protein
MMHNKGEEENDIQEGDNFIQDLELVWDDLEETKMNYEVKIAQRLDWVFIFDLQILWGIGNQKDIKNLLL